MTLHHISNAQGASEVAEHLAPSGMLRFGVLMLSYFAVEQGGGLVGWVPDIANELARRLGIPASLVPVHSPADMIGAVKARSVDATLIGITRERSAGFAFGPALIGLRTSFLVPVSSTVNSISEIDQIGLRIVVPAHSAQGEYLEKILKQATMLRVPVEIPSRATDLITAGQADAFSHVVPMLANAMSALPGSRILPGSYYNVPVALGYPKDLPPTVAKFIENFVGDMKASGFAQRAIDRMGKNSDGIVVEP